MAFWSKSSTLNAAVADWRERDLLDAPTAERLSDDIKAHGSGLSFQSILILLAVICLGFGAVTFVAANWDEIGRLTRIGIIFAAMWGAWIAAIGMHAKSHEWLAQSFVLLACILFGAGIMLISQIYHIQGEPKDAVWLWAIGTLLGAALTRSIPALSFAVILFSVWTYMEFDIFRSRYVIDYTFLIYLGLCALLARWMHSRFVGHLILLSLAGWTIFNAVSHLERQDADFLFITLFLSYALLAASLFSEGGKRFLRGFERPLIGYLAFTMGTLTIIWYVVAVVEHSSRYDIVFARSLLYPAIALLVVAALAATAYKTRSRNSYDLVITAISVLITGIFQSLATAIPFVFEAFLLAVTFWVIRMGWRLEYRPVTALGFLGFATIMLIIYFTTIGTLIGTSAFYIGVGLLLLVGVFIFPKLMRKKGDTS